MDADRQTDENTRAAMNQWIENWKVVSPILERERWQQLADRSRGRGEHVRRQGLRLDTAKVRYWGEMFAELKEDPDLLRPFETARRSAEVNGA